MVILDIDPGAGAGPQRTGLAAHFRGTRSGRASTGRAGQGPSALRAAGHAARRGHTGAMNAAHVPPWQGTDRIAS